MSRLIIIILASFILMQPSSVLAGEGDDRKAQVLSLYKDYKTSLKSGDTEAALKLAEQMYALTPEVYGKASKSHATATFNLAQMNELLNHRKASARLYQEHIDILDKLKMPENERYLAKLGLLSGAYLEANDADKAIKYGRKALKLAKDLNVSDELLAEYELKLGSYYYNSYGKGRKARQHINKAADMFSSIYGEQHFNTARALFWQAKLNMGFKKNRRAAELFENVLNIYNKELSSGHDRILQTHAFLVNVYEKLGETDKSTEHCIAVATERPLDFDRELRPLYKIPPTYPRNALVSRKEGYIVAEFTVDELGKVEDLKVIETTDKVFNKEALAALSKFRYAPTIRDGERVKTKGVLHKSLTEN